MIGRIVAPMVSDQPLRPRKVRSMWPSIASGGVLDRMRYMWNLHSALARSPRRELAGRATSPVPASAAWPGTQTRVAPQWTCRLSGRGGVVDDHSFDDEDDV